MEHHGRRGREAPAAVAFEPLVPSRRLGSGYPHSRYPFPPPCTARGSAAPLPPSHRGVHRALTVEDDTGTSSQGPRRPRVAFRTPRPVEALRIRLRAQPIPVPPSLHGTRLSRAFATQPRGWTPLSSAVWRPDCETVNGTRKGQRYYPVPPPRVVDALALGPRPQVNMHKATRPAGWRQGVLLTSPHRALPLAGDMRRFA